MEELLDQVERKARNGLKRDLQHVASDAGTVLEERLIRRHPLATLALAAAVGCFAVTLAPRVLRAVRAPGRLLALVLGLSRVLRGDSLAGPGGRT